jgi:hypothetical protein
MTNERDDSKAHIAALVTIAVAIVAYMVVREPITLIRPTVGIGERQSAMDLRLWQDPFPLVEESASAEKERSRQIKAKVKLDTENGGEITINIGNDTPAPQLYEDVWKDLPASKITSIFVLTDSSPFPEGKETRIRNRFAVVSALSAGCYLPMDGDRIDYITHLTQKGSAVIPFERYQKRTLGCDGFSASPGVGKIEHAIVFWIKESFELGQVKNLNSLAKSIATSFFRHFRVSEKDDLIDFKLIGPNDSTTFAQWIVESTKLKKEGEPLNWPTKSKNIELLSPWASTPVQLLEMQQQLPIADKKVDVDQAHYQQQVRQRAKTLGLTLSYSLPTDDKLFHALVSELALRRLDVSSDKIVLVGEWDTAYGRALPLLFMAAACVRGYIAKDSEQPSGIADDQKYTNCPTSLYRQLGQPLQRLATVHRLGITESHEVLCSLLLPAERSELLNCGESSSVSAHAARSAFQTDLFWQALLIVVRNPSMAMPNIKRYSYLRGLDGVELGVKTNKSDDSASSKRALKDKSTSNEDYEVAEGTKQFDYLRRLSERIKNENSTSDLRKALKAPVAAIGVLGTDTYDALVVLQALRQEFGSSHFFATDLDARYWHGPQSKWARNLIIASAFGLKLPRVIQGPVPPFRNSYQTSTFLAVLCSLGIVRPEITSTGQLFVEPAVPSENFRYEMQPRVFEVGNSGPIDLTQEKKSWLGTKEILLGLSGIALIVIIFIWPSRPFNLVSKYLGLALMLVLASATLAPTLYKLSNEPLRYREPFSFTEGVSVWPTEILLLVILVGSLFCIVKAHSVVAINSDIMNQYISNLNPAAQIKDLDEVKSIWSQYQQGEVWWRRAIRVILLLAAFVLMFVITNRIYSYYSVYLHPFFTPCRGVSCEMHFAIIKITLPLVLIMTLQILDLTRSCGQFVGQLGKIKTTDPSILKQIAYIIGARTATVGPLIYYPFIIFTVLMFTRNSYFDRWNYPVPYFVFTVCLAMIILVGAVLLKIRAEKVRGHILNSLMRTQIQADLGSTHSVDVESAIKYIADMKTGSFRSLVSQPSLIATLLAILAIIQNYV